MPMFFGLDNTQHLAGYARPLPVSTDPFIPRALAVPTIAGTPTAFKRFGDASATIYYFRATINAESDANAGTRLKNAYPYVWQMRPDSELWIPSDVPITSLHVVAVGSAESASLSSGEVVLETAASSEADYATADVRWDWDANEDVRLVSLCASDRQGANVTLHVMGFSNA